MGGRRRRSGGRVEGASAGGIALVVVLWTLLLLSLIAAGFLALARTEVRVARNALENARAEALADAGVYRAILGLLDSDPVQAWRADRKIRKFSLGGGTVRVWIDYEVHKFDLNGRDDARLEGLLQTLGLEQLEARALVDVILDFRDPDDLRRLNGAEDRDYRDAGLPWGAKDAPFEAVEELQQVLGVTGDLYKRLAPHVTPYIERPRSVTVTVQRGAVVRSLDARLSQIEEAAAAEGAQQDAEDIVPSDQPDSLRSGATVYNIRAEGTTESGALFIRDTVVRVSRDPQRPFVFLNWRQGGRRLFPRKKGGD